MSKIQDFLVVGTTFKNEDGKEIQQILKKWYNKVIIV